MSNVFYNSLIKIYSTCAPKFNIKYSFFNVFNLYIRGVSFLIVFILANNSILSGVDKMKESSAKMALLNKRVKKDLDYINYPPRDWLTPRTTKKGQHIYDVIIIGAGQTGLTVSLALRREQINNVLIVDDSKKNYQGSWLNFGKMKYLRTPKHTIGPDNDIPSLTVRSWFEAKFSEKAWNDLDYIPRIEWQNYLNWFRDVLNISVQYEHKAGAIEWDNDNQCYKIPILHRGMKKVHYARKIVLALGLQGSGEWMIPAFVKKNVDKSKYSQAVENVDKDKIKGKKVAILGAGPCAFDMTLDLNSKGAESITMFSKRANLVNLHCFKWGEYVGFMKSFPHLKDKDKLKFISRMHEMGQPPVPERVVEVFKLTNFKIKYSSPWEDAQQVGDKIVITTASGDTEEFDYLIIGTGWIADLGLRIELKNLIHDIALWKNKYTFDNDKNSRSLGMFPYLGKGFQFTPTDNSKAFYLNSLFNFTGGGLLSNGFCAGTGLTGIKYSVKIFIDEIVKQFFLEDKEQYYKSLDEYNNKDFILNETGV